MLPDYFEFTLPTKLIYGIGILDSIEDAVAKFKNRKVLLVTDKILVKAGPVGKVKKGFKKEIFTINFLCRFSIRLL